MLAGLIMLYIITGSFEMGNWMANAGEIQNHPFAIPAFLLLVVGAMTKSAQFPFHFWLPNAMKAPTPVSAYLHSATMVKAGVFLLFRLFPILGGMSLWSSVLIPVGALTIITGSLLAMGQSDLKRLLAYSTVSALGIMVLLIGIGSPLSIKTALVFLLVHAMYKGSLFLVAGGIDHATGTRDVRVLGGLSRNLPLTSTAAVLAGLSMAGLPPLAGFAAKELIYETTLADTASLALTVLLLAGNLVNILVAGWISWSVFFGKARGDIHSHHESINLYLPPLLLAFSGLFSGIWITETGTGIITPALAAVLQKSYPVKLSLWHGFTPMFYLSLLTLLLGFVLAYKRHVIQNCMEKICHLLEPVGPSNLYNRTIKAIISFANFQTSVLQNGYLRVYIMVILFTTFILTIGTMVFHLSPFPIQIWSIPRFYDVILLGIIITASIKVTLSNSRLTTIALLGSIGYCIAILFLLYSAPDLAMVQFSIETLVVILFILALYKLPKFSQLSSTPVRIFNLVIAIIGGGMMTFLMLLASSHPIESSLSTFFMENSYLAAKGRNVVNVILVDFRGFDTMGEISVLGIAAIGVYALIRFTRRAIFKTRPPKGDQT
jgi:multicomponent Na+:H+ antiporter subunit A